MSRRILPGILDSVSRGYTIESSILFDKIIPANDVYNDTTRPIDTGGHLIRDFGTPTSANTFTYSTWVKVGRLSASNGGAMDLLNCGPHDISQNNQFWFNDSLNLYSDGSAYFATRRKFRDVASWYHIVLACNASATGSDRVKLYVNGVLETEYTSDSRSSFPGPNKFNTAIGHSIGGWFYSSRHHWDGYFAETYFVDGQQLTADSFGQFDSNGIWKPKPYSGTYGNNGFYLKYSDSSSSYIHNSATATADLGGTPNNAKVYDGNFSISNTTSGASFNVIQYDMGSNVFMSGYEIRDFRFTGGTSTFKVQTSTDGTNWTDLSPLSITNTNQSFYGAIGRTARYVRLRATAFGTNGQSYIDYFGIHNYQIGKDFSGNNNHFGASSITTVLKNYEVPFSSTTNKRLGNYCVLSQQIPEYELTKKSYPYKGNTHVNSISADRHIGTFPLRNGKWYIELKPLTGDHVGGTDFRFGIINQSTLSNFLAETYPGNTGATGYSYWVTGSKYSSNFSTSSSSAYGATWGNGDTIGMALDLDNNKIWWSKNGVWQASGNPETGTGEAFSISSGDTWLVGVWNGNGAIRNKRFFINFGQFDYTYNPPTGFNPVNTSYLTTETIPDGRSYFDAKIYTGSSSQQTVTLPKLTPDLLLIKQRGGTQNYWNVTDNARGKAGNGFYFQLATNALDAETQYSATVSDMSNNSFTVSGNDGRTNQPGTTHISYSWKEAGQAGFDAVTYTAPSAGATGNISHNLGAVPQVIWTKSRSSNAYNWVVYVNGAMSNNQFLRLNTNDSLQTYGSGNSVWNTHTATTFAVVGDGAVVAGTQCVAYLWSEIPGFSKFGVYTANGRSGNGTFIHTGFKPKLVIIKGLNIVDDWVVEDSARNPINSNISGNFYERYLLLNSTINEGQEVLRDLYSNGFKIMGGPQNVTSGNTFIYMAFAENPFSLSTAR